jgi:hypothetical protein
MPSASPIRSMLAGKHERVRGQDYDKFIESFVTAVLERWPHVLHEALPGLIAAKMWEPVYRPYRCKLGSGR